MNAATLKFFSAPHVLRQVGRPLLTEFFERFTHLLPSKYFLPNPRPDNEAYFDSLAEVLMRTSELPDGLTQALLEVEALAATEESDNPPQTTDVTPLSHAIQSWLRCHPVSLVSIGGEGRPALRSLGSGGGDEAHQKLAAASSSSDPGTEPPGTPNIPHSELCIPHSETHGVSAFSPALPFLAAEPEPWPEPVDLKVLLDRLVELLKRFVILPTWAPETLALWSVHTYAFHLRDVTTYVGIESPEKRCGKTTLLSILNELAHRALASSNISPPAFFRVIEDLSPTLLIDEVDTFLTGNDQLRGILNAGYKKKTAFVLRAAPSPASNGETDAEISAAPRVVKRYSCWCPKALAKIGRFPDTLADRCIIIRMQRKTSKERCDRSRELDVQPVKRQCLRFVADHASEIASAQPQIPAELNDRAADIWEPLLVLADLAGGDWPETARKAALSLNASAQEASPIASLLIDIFILFTEEHADRMFTQALVAGLTAFGSRPWNESTKLKVLTDTWLAQQLRPYGIKPRTLRIGDKVLKGYLYEDLWEAFQRYVPKSTLQAFLDENSAAPEPTTLVPALKPTTEDPLSDG